MLEGFPELQSTGRDNSRANDELTDDDGRCERLVRLQSPASDIGSR
jgi:hypothetical protein